MGFKAQTSSKLECKQNTPLSVESKNNMIKYLPKPREMTILYFLSSLKRKYFVPRFIIFLFSVSLRQLETKQQEESTEENGY